MALALMGCNATTDQDLITFMDRPTLVTQVWSAETQGRDIIYAWYDPYTAATLDSIAKKRKIDADSLCDAINKSGINHR